MGQEEGGCGIEGEEGGGVGWGRWRCGVEKVELWGRGRKVEVVTRSGCDGGRLIKEGATVEEAVGRM